MKALPRGQTHSPCTLTPRRINGAVPGAKQGCPAHTEGVRVSPENPSPTGDPISQTGVTPDCLGHFGHCWGRDLGARAGGGFGGPWQGRCGGLSPPGIVVQGSFPLLQGQVTLHRGLCKLLCRWLEEKAQQPSGHRGSTELLACQAGAPCPWPVLRPPEQGDTSPSTLEEGAATEPWMPEAAAAWEVEGAGRSPASLLSGKKGTLPSSKLAMVVSTQLVWTAGTKGPVRDPHTPSWLSLCTSAAGTRFVLPLQSLLTQVCPDDLQGYVRQHLLDLLCHGHDPHVLRGTPGQAGGHPGPGCRPLAGGCRRRNTVGTG